MLILYIILQYYLIIINIVLCFDFCNIIRLNLFFCTLKIIAQVSGIILFKTWYWNGISSNILTLYCFQKKNIINNLINKSILKSNSHILFSQQPIAVFFYTSRPGLDVI